MPNFGVNWIDLVILLIVVYYFWEGLGRGFWVLVRELGSFLGALALALRFYPEAANFLTANFGLPGSFANALGFLLVAFVSQIILSWIFYRFVLAKLPKKLLETQWQKIGAAAASVLNGLVLVAFILTLLVSLPLNPKIKSDVTSSKIGGYLVVQTVRFESTIADIFGGALRDTLTYLTIEPQSRERIELPVQPPKQELKVDEQAEVQMLALVNKERREQGIPELTWSPKIVVVARAHSRDMWERKYFSHVDPDGNDPGDRLSAGGVEYSLAGENIALAPTVSMAHQGLMNSEGHRRNILGPGFRKIGIGVIDGGIYGKMITQNFTD